MGMREGAVGTTVHIELDDGEAIETSSRTFDAGEHGVTIGLRVIPWHRLRAYWWELPVPGGGDPDESGPRPTVRVELGDGTSAGEELHVDGDHFEVTARGISFIVEDRVEPERGVVVHRMMHVPWGHVREFERVRIDASRSMPTRPDTAEV
jgi:hypothetical protein